MSHTRIGKAHVRRALALLVAASVAAGCAEAGVNRAAQVPDVPDATAPSRKANFGPYAVGVRTETFVDTSRPTAPSNGVPGKPSRTLRTLVLYPALGEANNRDVPDAPPARDDGPFPLIEFSHGFTASGPAYTLLLRQFAAAGYVVAAPTFPLSSGGTPGGPNVTDYRNQPADVSFVISEMLRVNDDASSPLQGLIDPDNVAVAGHSLGAITTLGAAYNDCCQDARIKAAVPISGLELPFPNGKFFTQPAAPLLLIHGDEDRTVPYSGSANAYRDASAPKFLLTIEKGPHTPFFGPGGQVIVKVMRDFFDHYLKGRGGSLDAIPKDGNVAGTTALVSELA
jgi:alpha-beta hydrolase superfamily lysophospholipase